MTVSLIVQSFQIELGDEIIIHGVIYLHNQI